MWRLILATQVATITDVEFIIGGDERQIDGGAKNSLLEWVRNRVRPYPKGGDSGLLFFPCLIFFSVRVDNFTSSWRDGLAFLAILHSQNPSLFNFDAIDPSRSHENLELAFEIAEKEFQIPKLLEVNDVAGPNPDERTIMT